MLHTANSHRPIAWHMRLQKPSHQRTQPPRPYLEATAKVRASTSTVVSESVTCPSSSACVPQFLNRQGYSASFLRPLTTCVEHLRHLLRLLLFLALSSTLHWATEWTAVEIKFLSSDHLSRPLSSSRPLYGHSDLLALCTIHILLHACTHDSFLHLHIAMTRLRRGIARRSLLTGSSPTC